MESLLTTSAATIAAVNAKSCDKVSDFPMTEASRLRRSGRMRQPLQFWMGTSDDREMSTPESPTIQQMLCTICFDISVDLMIAKIGLSFGVLPTPNPGGMTTMLFCLTADYTPQALNAMRENPNTNRQAAVEQLLSAAGGKLVAMYGRASNGPGVMVIFDVTDPAMAPAITGVAVSAGTVQNLQLTRLFTMDEIAGIRQKAGQIRGAYKPPGQQ